MPRTAYISVPISLLISIILYESSHFLFRIISKYKVKRFNCSRFSKRLRELGTHIANV